jgi:hypothetical protein
MLVCLSSTGSVSADVPQVRNVVVWDDGGTTKLNVTVYHSDEVPSHLVDLLTVTLTSGPNLFQEFPQTGPHTLDSSTRTFNVTLDIGSVSDAPLATVQAHCNLHGSSSQNWTGTVPEYAQVMFMLTLSVTIWLVLLLCKRRSKSIHTVL